jgi:hypothetical protein
MYFPTLDESISKALVVQPRSLAAPAADSFRQFVKCSAHIELRVEKRFGSELSHILQIRVENEFTSFQKHPVSFAIHVPVLSFMFRPTSTIATCAKSKIWTFRFPSPSLRVLVCVKISTKRCTSVFNCLPKYRLFACAQGDLHAQDFPKFKLMHVGCAGKDVAVNALEKQVQKKVLRNGKYIDMEQIKKFGSKELWASQLCTYITDELRPQFASAGWKYS